MVLFMQNIKSVVTLIPIENNVLTRKLFLGYWKPRLLQKMAYLSKQGIDTHQRILVIMTFIKFQSTRKRDLYKQDATVDKLGIVIN